MVHRLTDLKPVTEEEQIRIDLAEGFHKRGPVALIDFLVRPATPYEANHRLVVYYSVVLKWDIEVEKFSKEDRAEIDFAVYTLELIQDQLVPDDD